MGKWTEYDPNTGVVETNYYDELTDELITHKTQDCTEAVDEFKAIANSGEADAGIKNGVWKYMSIPIGVQYELLYKHGIDITNRDHWPRLFDVVNKEYPHCKLTHKVHAFRNGSRRIHIAG